MESGLRQIIGDRWLGDLRHVVCVRGCGGLRAGSPGGKLLGREWQAILHLQGMTSDASFNLPTWIQDRSATLAEGDHNPQSSASQIQSFFLHLHLPPGGFWRYCGYILVPHVEIRVVGEGKMANAASVAQEGEKEGEEGAIPMGCR